jgi:GH35 family endo-1,4-beta-xylanase
MKKQVSICLAVFGLGAGVARADLIAENPPTFYNGAEFPGAKGSLTVTPEQVAQMQFDFTGGGHYVEMTFRLPQPRAVRRVAFSAEKPQGYFFTVRVTDSQGQTFQKTVHHAAEGWAAFRFDMENWTGSWGGPGDGALVQPIRSFAILLENARLPVATGMVRVKEVSLEELPPEEAAAMAGTKGNASTRYAVTDFGAGDVNAFERWGFNVGNSDLQKGVWRVDFSKHAEARVSHSLAILGAPEEFALSVEADAEAAGAELALNIGSHFMSFTRPLGALQPPAREGGKIVQTFRVPAPPAEGWSWHGGANDGKPQYPLRFTHLMIYRANAKPVPVTIRLLPFEAQTRIAPSKRLALRTYVQENPFVIKGELRNLDDREARECDLTVELKDWNGQLMDTVKTNLAPVAPGQTQIFTTVPVDLHQPKNFCEIVSTVTTRTAPRVSASWTSTWVKPLEDEGPGQLRPELPWGMGIYLYRNGNDENGHRNMGRVAAAAQAAGVKWTREEFQWGRIEPRKGQFDFSFYDKMVETARSHGISVYALFGYWTPWTKAYEEEGFRDYCNALRETVRRYKHVVKHWEIYNEPNIFFWSGPRERYPALLKMAYDTVKAEDPDAQVLGCSTAGIDTKFIQMCLDAGAPFDALTIHPYRGALHEESFIAELEAVKRQVGGRQVWITEMGWPTIPGNVTERQQAALLARSYLSAVGSGACPNMSWYNFKNDGWNPYYNEENFGILQHDLTPKPAYRALAQICRTFTSGEPSLETLPVPDSHAKVFVFRMGKGCAIWTDGAEVTVYFVGGVNAQNLMGELMPFALVHRSSAHNRSITISAQSPVFFPDFNPDLKDLLFFERSTPDKVIEF